MNIEQMKTVLKEILNKTDLTPCVVGHRGVGKTAGVIQVCREIDREYVPLRLGQMEVGDLVGIPYREGRDMHWSRPSWWPADDAGPTVVHCDELNRAQQEDTLQAIFQFVEPPSEGQQRALHTHKLAPQHRVVVAINPPDGSYQVTPLDRALLDRMVVLQVETDAECWARHAHRENFHTDVRQFIAGNQQMLSTNNQSFDMQVEPSERAWEIVSTLRENCRFPQELEMEVYSGVIGREAAVSFLQWCTEQRLRPLSAEDILDRWTEVAVQATEQRDDIQAATMSDLIACLQNDPDLTDQQQDSLVAYIDVLPRDMRFGLVKSLLRIPQIAAVLCQDRYDATILETIQQISRDVA
ncbi:MAG: AAA domain-containing protein [Desulfuromonadaceae bacterium]|nr:AAA domain-containing protein [Desulfuromonadaceae bacterium]